MSTSSGSTTLANVNARQINSDEAIRNRQEDQGDENEDEGNE
mgnify:CR=1 FL=1